MKDILTFESLDAILGTHAPFLISLSDGLEEELRIVIAKSYAGDPGTKVPDLSVFDASTAQALAGILAESRPIEPDNTHTYEIRFEHYILYQVQNESYAGLSPQDAWRGTHLRLFDRSKLLEDLPSLTIAQRLEDGSCFPGPWTHYGISAQNHFIDIISHVPPIITALT